MPKRKVFDDYDEEEEVDIIRVNKKPKHNKTKLTIENSPPVNNIKDLICIGEKLVFYKNINVIALWEIMPYLKELDNMIGMDSLKDTVFYQVIYYLQNMHTRNKNEEYLHTIITAGPGCGKCTGFNTPIIMYNGEIKLVQNIKVGDLLMGDDSAPRKVLSLGRGRDIMYKITNQKNEFYTVNSEHILSLYYSCSNTITKRIDLLAYELKWFYSSEKRIKKKYFSFATKDEHESNIEATNFMNSLKNSLYIDISVQDYLSLPKYIKKKLTGYKVPIEFVAKELPIDSYIIGYWLGSTTNNSQIMINDPEILAHFKKTYNKLITINSTGENSNILLHTLKNLNLINNKHIPNIYKYNSRENRLKLLAGLLDSNGRLYKSNIFEFSHKNEVLINDIIYLARSLGFFCYKTQNFPKMLQNNKISINIYGGEIEKIPTIMSQKQAITNTSIPKVLMSRITIERLEEDDYYGFTLDGNHRFLLGDFTVTHNTTVAKIIGNIYTNLGILYNKNKNNKFTIGYRDDFVAEYLGQTAIKTRRFLESCIGGVLFIDEVYSLGAGEKDKDSFSKEAIDTLCSFLSENKNNFCCIVAGYKDEIKKCFLSVNSGLERRFPWKHDINEYTVENLASIFIKMIKETKWILHEDVTLEFIIDIFRQNKDIFKYTGGSIETFISKIKMLHSKRIFSLDTKHKFIIKCEDIKNAIDVTKKNNTDKQIIKYDYYT